MKKEAAPILFIDETESTNRFLTNNISAIRAENGFMVVAAYQNSGRGQAGNVWESNKDENLLCSTVFYPHFLAPNNQFYLSKIVALAAFDLLHPLVENVSLKWPNDLYCDDKKIGGILIENSIMGNRLDTSVAGIGINVNQIKFSDTLPNPVSLALLKNQPFDVKNLAETLQQNLIGWFTVLENGDTAKIDAAYFEKLYRKKGEWLFSSNGKCFTASIQTVLPTGQLVLKTSEGLKEFWFKEVEFVI